MAAMTDKTKGGFEPGSFLFTYRQISTESYWHHAHRGIEMLYIYEGHGEIRVDNRTYPIGNDSLVWFQPYQVHRVAVPFEPGRSYIRTNLTLDPAYLEPYLAPFPGLGRFFRHLCKGNLREPFVPSVRDTPIRDLLERIHAALNDSSPGRDEDVGLLLLNLIRQLREHPFRDEADAAVGAAPMNRARSHAERITEWLDLHYKRPFKLEELAESLHLSPYHVSHVFKKSAGMTLSEYLIRRRVREACALLANTSKSVQEIASEVGGLSTSYFCQMFRKAKGLSPEQYRQSIR